MARKILVETLTTAVPAGGSLLAFFIDSIICDDPKTGPWRLARRCTSLANLIEEASHAAPLNELGILSHGDVGGRIQLGSDVIDPGTIGSLEPRIKDLAKSLNNNAVLTILGCVSGVGKGGSALLKRLSTLLPSRAVVGFNTVTLVNPTNVRKNASGVCYEPDMWASTEKNSINARLKGFKDGEKAVPDARAAKIAKDGKITKWPDDETSARDDSTIEEQRHLFVPSNGGGHR